MRRMQIYLDEEVYEVLRTESKARKTTISNLIRQALQERYAPGHKKDELLDGLYGIWKDYLAENRPNGESNEQA